MEGLGEARSWALRFGGVDSVDGHAMSEQLWAYFWISVGALAGTLARVGQWRKADDSVDWWKAVGELCAFPAIVFLVAGALQQWAPNVDDPVRSAVAATVALVGISSIEALVLKVLNRKADSV